jgi:flagellar FliL protein
MGKLKLIVPVAALIVAAGVYKFVVAKPAPAPQPKIAGEVYVVPSAFTVNLAGGRYAKVTVGMILKEGAALGPESGGEPAAPPEGFGPLAQEAIVRDIVVNALSGTRADMLMGADGRQRIKQLIERRVKALTDVEIERVLLPDVTVQ